MQLLGALIGAGGTILQGEAANASGKSEQMQLNQQAGQDRAISQIEATRVRRSARYAQSRALALAAASGAGASDPTVVNLIGGIAGEGEFQALSALYTGEESARGQEFAGKIARKEGSSAKTASYFKAAGTLLSGASSWADKYGGDGGFGSAFDSRGRVKGSVVQGTSIADYNLGSSRYA